MLIIVNVIRINFILYFEIISEGAVFAYIFRHDIIPSSTVGCAVSVIAHQYRAGTTDEQTELIELWDIGGSTVHQKASVNFFDGSLLENIYLISTKITLKILFVGFSVLSYFCFSL